MPKQSKINQLIERLKVQQLSNFQACILVNSAHADRLIRKIRAYPPIGYELLEETARNENNTPYLKFYLNKKEK
jgi:hypothetical protein